MNLEFPYQLVAFLGEEPLVGESVYYGENGWYPQIALKRRFKVTDVSEDVLFDKLENYFAKVDCFSIRSKNVIKPKRVPVQIIKIDPSPQLITFHTGFIKFMGNSMLSKYPERDGANYLPHITIEYDGEIVVDAEQYTNRSFPISRVCLLKDVDGENSVAHNFFNLSK